MGAHASMRARLSRHSDNDALLLRHDPLHPRAPGSDSRPHPLNPAPYTLRPTTCSYARTLRLTLQIWTALILDPLGLGHLCAREGDTSASDALLLP